MGKNSHILSTNTSYRRFSTSHTFSDWQCFRRQQDRLMLLSFGHSCFLKRFLFRTF